jgi:CRISPR-associated protein Cas5h
MFVFEIWGKFASFRDPFTISQNISLSIPPKTAVAGMMASILGIEEYLGRDDFSDFGYSVVALNPIRKKSFSQNYINDYTSKVQTHLNSLKKGDFEKVGKGLRDNKSPQKPINRELLLDVRYLIFVKRFKYEDKISSYLKNRISRFPLYLGNSEFAGGFRFVPIYDAIELLNQKSVEVDSFVLEEDISNIVFQNDTRYSKISFATKLNEQRTPLVFANVVLGTSPIRLKDISGVYKIKTANRTYYCRFV